MQDHPEYKYRPRRKPKNLKAPGYPYTMPYPSVSMEALRAGEWPLVLSVVTMMANDKMWASLKEIPILLLYVSHQVPTTTPSQP